MTVVEDVVQPTAEDLEEYEQYKCKSIPLDCHMGLNVLNRAFDTTCNFILNQPN